MVFLSRQPALPDTLDEERRTVRHPPGQTVIPREAVWQLNDAHQMLADAQAEASRLARAAQDAYDEMRERGYADGREAARREHAMHMIEQVASSLGYLEQVETRMVELVLSAVRRIVCDTPEHQRVADVVRSVLAAARTQPQLTLRLSPSQADLIQPQLDEILSAYPHIRAVHVQPDTHIAPDSCILESDLGFIETSLETQLEALRTAFVKVLGAGHSSGEPKHHHGLGESNGGYASSVPDPRELR
ncbi:HrpE/YscL family type III secretion apparatus protein [Paraburkholderia bonniea]|uniref:HrpE/YscL family type III secretion apparatus protein n=1 Tax=Paraburkholderia bonniea TaxID=2152891 RepID=UPI0012927271|nr:HrpE/YscL family type III secretion apparatus protein [Paraburkholderia bonniea]WJF89297.1 HrpE/YscL family type III secretion apparatus protein [Paraburkholderia bonniea]WJF92613.1 HrpE/YscL family type III secretion apparatus protein [Paraburkholderia bonniea]